MQPHRCPSVAGRLPGSSSEQKHHGVPAGLGVAPSGARTGDSPYCQEAVRAGAGDCGTQGSTEPAARGRGRGGSYLIPASSPLPRPPNVRTLPARAALSLPTVSPLSPPPTVPQREPPPGLWGAGGLCEAGSHRLCPQTPPLTGPGFEQMVSETPSTCDVLRSPKSMTRESGPQRTVGGGGGGGWVEGAGPGRASEPGRGSSGQQCRGLWGWTGGPGEERRMLRLSLSSCGASGLGLDGW